MTTTLLQQALDALEEATAYTSSPSWSPSMTEECTAVAASIRAHLAAQPTSATQEDDPLTNAELRAGVALQLREIDRLRVTNKMLQDDKAALQVEYDHAVEQAAKNCDEVLALREQLALAETVRAAQVAGLTEGADALQRDAARYVYLRDVAWHSGSLIFYAERYGPEDWDEQIDAARAALKGGVNG